MAEQYTGTSSKLKAVIGRGANLNLTAAEEDQHTHTHTHTHTRTHTHTHTHTYNDVTINLFCVGEKLIPWSKALECSLEQVQINSASKLL